MRETSRSLAAHFQGAFGFQQLCHHFLGDVAPEGVPDEIPLFDVVGELLPQFVEGMGQVRHFPHPPLRHRHRKVAFPHLPHPVPEAGDGPGDGTGKPQSREAAHETERQAGKETADHDLPVEGGIMRLDLLFGLHRGDLAGFLHALLRRQEKFIQVDDGRHDERGPRDVDPHRKPLSLLFLLIEKLVKTLHVVFREGTLDHFRGLRVFLLPIQLVPALDVLVRVKQDVTVPVI